MRSTYERVCAAREAGRVQRCHTVPHHGVYDIAQHSYNCLTLLDVLYPDAPKSLMRALLFHDFAERYTGDTPAPFKWRRPVLDGMLKEYEDHILKEFSFYTYLDERESWWFRSIDLLELWLWARDQTSMGNTNVDQIILKAENWFDQNQTMVPKPVRDFIVLLDEYYVRTEDDFGA